MTKLLEEVLSRISQLPDKRQDEIAALLLDELESEARWDEAFANSQNELSRLADEALEEFERGETRPCD